jgi:hypothetical protein
MQLTKTNHQRCARIIAKSIHSSSSRQANQQHSSAPHGTRNAEAQQRTDGISSHWMESEAQQRTERGNGASDVPRGAIVQDEKEHRGQGGHRRPPPWRVPGLRRGPPATGTKKRERERRGEGVGLLARKGGGDCGRRMGGGRRPRRGCAAPSTARATGSA